MRLRIKRTFLLLLAVVVTLFGVLNSCTLEQPFSLFDTGRETAQVEFNYQTTRPLKMAVQNGPPNGIIEAHYRRASETDSVLVATFLLDKWGNAVREVTIPTFVDRISFNTNSLGVPNSIILSIDDLNSITLNYKKLGEYQFLEDDGSPSFNMNSPLFSVGSHQKSTNFNVLGEWNSMGYPEYLDKRETLSQSFLQQVNASLPELEPVPEYNPHYIASSSETNLILKEEGEVFVTFVHEGAGYKNVLGFYTYPKGSPPLEVSDEDITIIFPNVSYAGSGGALSSGDTVYLGKFPQDTVIGWTLIANGFSSRRRKGTVSSGLNRFYSNDELNPEQTDNEHAILLHFEEEDKYILSFEDLLRSTGDNDFNDAIFTVRVTPDSAVDSSNVLSTEDQASIDSDNDGVLDEYDIEPFNNNVTYSVLTPANGKGTLVYEDLWPYRGDYDFNDIVLLYQFEEFYNSDDKIVKLQGEFLLTGYLASMNNGFAFELEIPPLLVQSVLGGEFSRNYMFNNASGVEKRQEKAVVTVFESGKSLYNPSKGYEGGIPITVTVEFSRGLTRAELGYPPYNPFIMSNGERGREVHLPGKQPTSLAHYEYFGSQEDATILGSTYSYKSADKKPWALHLPEPFTYPYDSIAIEEAYLHYQAWVDSEGEQFTDWYRDLTGYRNNEVLIEP